MGGKLASEPEIDDYCGSYRRRCSAFAVCSIATTRLLNTPLLLLPLMTANLQPGQSSQASFDDYLRTTVREAVRQWSGSASSRADTTHVAQLPSYPPTDALFILLPLLIVLSTFLFLLLLFLVCIVLIRRRRGIMLRDNDGPVDMSREELMDSEGVADAFESRWLESVSESERRAHTRARGARSPYASP
jgi:hypothetical protein